MRVPVILTALIAMASTGHAECLSSANAVWAAHPGSHATWRLRLPGHEGTKFWFASSSERKGSDAQASTDAAHKIRTISAMAIPRPRPRLDTLAETERAPLHPSPDRPCGGRTSPDLISGVRPHRRRATA